ncbi:hypothetical protein IC620_10810 [Hazenella sp. IB182357]|uniref:Beta-ketoacyl-[acyl-carrier-protein] synthase III C-terminal domain-containing protein n=1 Tax=Polycladospora coralii TaxID=2771432 RepID=A0A926N9U0_9BACL|nr:3-oxoacyl-[acyl-carrier-protein] synthase III C-terminal domain-containing protein [Polycladospora coralii]MBD1372846.1 hypothetical protein [Polycladospora coralii]MBS7529465.1 hypothetical protein [Polycladospora coralii]
MVYIDKVYAHVPKNRMSIQSLQSNLGLKNYQVKLFEKVHGLNQICMDSEHELKEMLQIAIHQLMDQNQVELKQIKYIIFCHTSPLVAPYPHNVLEEVLSSFELDHALYFSLTQQHCSSGLIAMEVADSLLASDPNNDDQALILIGEKAFHPTCQLIPNTTIMGEASAAVVVGKNGEQDEVLTVHRKIMGKYAAGIQISPADAKDFEEKYTSTLIETVEEALHQVDKAKKDVAWIIPHNVNQSSWKQFAKQFDFPLSRIYLENVSRLGHCFGADPFINYQDMVRQNLLQKGDLYLMVSVGLGATFAVSVMKH